MSSAKVFRLMWLVALILPNIFISTQAAQFNGFDIDNALIDSQQILAGGPEKDGIPALDSPKFVKATAANHIKPNDRILGITVNDIQKAYPISILNWHEIVNDISAGESFAITYCPLCGTGIAFASEVDGKTLDFGVSGLLYNSDVLLYDRATESLWSQIIGKAVSGPMKGKKLERLPLTHTTWSDWVEQHPDTLALSQQTGYSRDYSRNPYSGYEKTRTLYFQVSNQAPALYHPKERVLGLQIGEQFKAYPFSEIDKTGQIEVQDRFAGSDITIHWDSANQKASMTDSAGKPIAAVEGFWFAWFAFHPETEVFKANK